MDLMHGNGCGKPYLSIFIPFHLLQSPSSDLFGVADLNRGRIIVTGTDSQNLNVGGLHAPLDKIGTWKLLEGNETFSHIHSQSPPAVVSLQGRYNELPTCSLYGGFRSCAKDDVTIIMYDKDKMQHAPLLMSGCKLPGLDHTDCDNNQVGTNIRTLCSSLALDQQSRKRLTRGKDFFSGACYMLLKALLLVVYPVCCVTRCLRNSRITKNKVVSNVMNIPTVSAQLKHKAKEASHATETSHGTPLEALRCSSTIWKHALDVCAGVLLMVLLINIGTDQIAAALMTWAEYVADRLQSLLHWMMGAPGGLKLNYMLDQFLGRFFLYHIHLWTGYLQVLRPVLPAALLCICASGCCGVTLQFSLLQDLLSMMTLHIYCFYVYAARLYSLLVIGLSSLWRLFRGKKWNVLRQRVDSASYDVNQLFMGTLLFTILLFLLPTVALYYVVFTGMRILVLVVQGLVHKVVLVINTFPIYPVVLKLVGSTKMCGNVRYHVVTKHSDGPLFLSMQLLPVSFSRIWEEFGGPLPRAETWGSFLAKLFKGHLIYPWIDFRNGFSHS